MGDGAVDGNPLYVPPGRVSADAMSQGLEARDASFSGDANRVEGLLPSIYFDFDQAFVQPQERPKLVETADYLRDNPEARLLIEGHCDYKGTSEYNLALGDRRASNVKQYLEQIGIRADRIQVVSRGDLEAQEGANASQRAQDRRADLIVLR